MLIFKFQPLSDLIAKLRVNFTYVEGMKCRTKKFCFKRKWDKSIFYLYRDIYSLFSKENCA